MGLPSAQCWFSTQNHVHPRLLIDKADTKGRDTKVPMATRRLNCDFFEASLEYFPPFVANLSRIADIDIIRRVWDIVSAEVHPINAAVPMPLIVSSGLAIACIA